MFCANTSAKSVQKAHSAVPKCKADMQSHLKSIFVVWSVALTLASTSASALTLGRLRGSVLLGKELDVLVNVQFAADEDGSATCFDVDIVYGEIPVERSRINLQSKPGAEPNSQIVHIASSLPVNEAVVSLILKAACGPKAIRRYVLLSEVVSDTSPTGADSVPLGKPVVARVQSVASQPTQPPAVSPASAVDQSSGVAKAKRASVVKKVPISRLKVAPLALPDLKSEVAATGKPLNSAPIEELQRRVEELEKAQAGNTDADQLLKNASLAKAMEADIESLRVATAKNQKNLQTMVTALDSAPAKDSGRGLIYLLAGLLAVCMAALAYIILRLRNTGFDASPWWSGSDGRLPSANRSRSSAHAPLMPSDGAESGQAGLAATVAGGLAAKTTAPASIQSQPVELDVDTARNTLVMDVRPVKISPESAREKSPPQPEFVNSNFVTIKTINTKEMLDVRQQAEFYMALGQHDEAVHLLESNIKGSTDANPLIFLDLLNILHTLSRRAEFERYREEFNLQFTGRILDYANFHSEGNGLDAYEDICQQIVVLWPSEYTIDYIEQCLVRTPEDDPEQGIDLEAFKDLLLLYGVLRRLDQSNEAYQPFSTSRTAQAQTSAPSGDAEALHAKEETSPPLPVIDLDSQPADLDVDIDLDLDLDLSPGLDIDLDVSEAMTKPEKPSNNLIDFDMPDFVKPNPGKSKNPG